MRRELSYSLHRLYIVLQYKNKVNDKFANDYIKMSIINLPLPLCIFIAEIFSVKFEQMLFVHDIFKM